MIEIPDWIRPVIEWNIWDNFWQIGSALIGGWIAMKISRNQSESDRSAAIESIFIQKKVDNLGQLIFHLQSAGGDLYSLTSFCEEIEKEPIRLVGDNGTKSYEHMGKIYESLTSSFNQVIAIKEINDFKFIDLENLTARLDKLQSCINLLGKLLDKGNPSTANNVNESIKQIAIDLLEIVTSIKDEVRSQQRDIRDEYLK